MEGESAASGALDSPRIAALGSRAPTAVESPRGRQTEAPGDPDVWFRACHLSLAAYYTPDVVCPCIKGEKPLEMLHTDIQPGEYHWVHYQPQGRASEGETLHKCQWLVAIPEPAAAAEAVFVAFKGTDGLLDMMFVNCPTDTESHRGSRLHSGAWVGVQGELPGVMAQLRHAQEVAPKLSRVVFVGHSLGGAYATVSLLELTADPQWPQQLQAEAVTFGAPFILAQETADQRLQIPRGVWRPRMTHFVFGFDIIPRAFCLSHTALKQWMKGTAALLVDEHVGSIPVVGAQVSRVLKQKLDGIADGAIRKIQTLTRFRAAGSYVFLNSAVFRTQSGGPVRRTEAAFVPGVPDARGVPVNPLAEDLLSFLPAVGPDSPCCEALADTQALVCQATADDHMSASAYLPAVRHISTDLSVRWSVYDSPSGSARASPALAPAPGPEPSRPTDPDLDDSWELVAAALAELESRGDPTVACAADRLRRALAGRPAAAAPRAAEHGAVHSDPAAACCVASVPPVVREHARCDDWASRVFLRAAVRALALPSAAAAAPAAAVALLVAVSGGAEEDTAAPGTPRGTASARGGRAAAGPGTPRRVKERRNPLAFAVSRLDTTVACTFGGRRRRLPPGGAALLDGCLTQGGPLRLTGGAEAAGATSTWIDVTLPHLGSASHITVEHSCLLGYVLWESRCVSSSCFTDGESPKRQPGSSTPDGDARDLRPLYPILDQGKGLCCRIEGRHDEDALVLHYHKLCSLLRWSVQRYGGFTWAAQRPYSVADHASCAAVAAMVVSSAEVGRRTSMASPGLAASLVFGAGYNDNAQLGMGTKVPHKYFSPVVSLAGRDVVDVTCGSGETLALCRDGTVLGTGRNRDGSLGFGHRKPELSFTETPLPGRCVHICSGYNHSMVQLEDGSVHSAGLNNCGQLGLGSFADQTRFTPVTDLAGKDVIALSAGDNFSFALCSSGEVLACGYNVGNLGLGDTSTRTRFVEVPSLSTEALPQDAKVAAIRCGRHDTVALTNTGVVLGAGANKCGRLGLGTTTPVTTFQPIMSLKDHQIRTVSLGYYQSFVISCEGKVLACGCNDSGELGMDDTVSRTRFEEVPGLVGARCSDVACGCYCTFVVTGHGDVLACGLNKRGNLGIGAKQIRKFTPVHQLRGAAARLCPSRFNYNTFALSQTGPVELGDGDRADSPQPSGSDSGSDMSGGMTPRGSARLLRESPRASNPSPPG
eukprot:TRINITY_DN21061_c0_g1_i1.p1 TRINITY_DN21061_c0_g1~~TRINITY_DN21061_c0_g1_i1.p1  ORF type:complete len:1245 (+),score=286.53 TRINITY_DN21061_c0_g1_i1:75-3737(+)